MLTEQYEIVFPVELGALLRGVSKISSSKGIEEWFDFPRYRVVGLHYKEPMMFVEVLNSNGTTIGTERMPMNSGQYQNW